jgi:hypothetical protein
MTAIQVRGWIVGAPLVALLLLAGGCATSRPDAVAEIPTQSYLRQASSNGVMSLEVCARAFVPARGQGPTVWLVGVTHLGESRYYTELQQFLDQQTLVLFEGIGAANGEFQSVQADAYSLQEDLAHSLGLAFQVNVIEYDRPHFRNSDLTLDQLEAAFRLMQSDQAMTDGGLNVGQLLELMEGEGLLGALARLATAVIAASPRLQAAAKVTMIEIFSALPTDLKDSTAVPAGMQPLLSVLIDERNKVVVHDLESALHTKPKPRSVALFYGAGHMADLERRVRETLRYRPSEERWFIAFGVNVRRSGLTAIELDLVRRLVRQELSPQ